MDPHFDLGILAPGEGRTFSVRFKNSSSSSVTIEKVSTSCGCTAAKAGQGKEVEPGAETAVELHFNGLNTTGPVKLTVAVLSRGAAREYASQVEVGGWVLPGNGLGVEPKGLNLGEIDMSETKVRVIRVYTTRPEKTVSVSSSSSRIVFNRLTPTDKIPCCGVAALDYKVSVSGGPDDLAGSLKVSAEELSAELPIFARVKTQPAVKPDKQFFGKIPSKQESLTGTFWVLKQFEPVDQPGIVLKAAPKNEGDGEYAEYSFEINGIGQFHGLQTRSIAFKRQGEPQSTVTCELSFVVGDS